MHFNYLSLTNDEPKIHKEQFWIFLWVHLLSFQVTKNNLVFRLFTFCTDHEPKIPNLQKKSKSMCPITIRKPNNNSRQCFSAHSCSLFETICLYIEPFSNTLTFSGEHDPGTAKPFYPKSSLNLTTTLKKFPNSSGYWSMPRKVLRFRKFIF